MEKSHDYYYQIIVSQDARFDGIFFTAVKTTGIYCRPICKVPAPKQENCSFYVTAAQAESHGYRPCLRCRPELAPAYSESGQGHALMSAMVHWLEDTNYEPGSVGKMAQVMGITPRHVLRVFKDQLGISPSAYIQSKRLLRAKALLTDTQIKVSEIGPMVGFNSPAQFYACLKRHYKLSPSQMRGKTMEGRGIKVVLTYRPPYAWSEMMAFYRFRAIPGLEVVTQEDIYRRALSIEGYNGWIQVKAMPEKNGLELTISDSLERVVLHVIRKVRLAFDLDACLKHLPKVLPEGIRLPGCFDVFEMSLRAILGQQITVKAGRTLGQRMVALLGEPLESPWHEVAYTFPNPQAILELKAPIEQVLYPLGIIKTRARAIEAVAQAIASNYISLKPYDDPQVQRQRLLSLKGIGPWTADYLLMRGMHWPDAFPMMDTGIVHGLLGILSPKKVGESKYQRDKRIKEEALAYAKDFEPWRSYLTIALWQGWRAKEVDLCSI